MFCEIIVITIAILGVYYYLKHGAKDTKAKSIESIKKIVPFTKHIIKTNIDAIKTYDWNSGVSVP